MRSTRDFQRELFSRTKNLLTEQTFLHLTSKVNTPAFSATLGLGLATATSWVALVHGGGFSDQRVTAAMRSVSPTAQGAENLGIILRVQCVETGDAASTHYYYVRCQTGNARITRVIGNAFVNLASQAFVLPQNGLVTIDASVVGDTISASFSASGCHTGTTDLTTGGLYGGGGTLDGTEFDIELLPSGSPITVTLTAPANAAAAVAAINTAVGQTVAINIGNRLTINGITAGTSGGFTIAAGSPDALAVLGLTAGTYTGPANVSISAEDVSEELDTGGLMGVRTTSQAGYCSQFTAEQL